MPEYFIEWRIELFADTPEQAARNALAIQRDPGNRANTFHVTSGDGECEAVDVEELDQLASNEPDSRVTMGLPVFEEGLDGLWRPPHANMRHGFSETEIDEAFRVGGWERRDHEWLRAARLFNTPR